MAGAVATYHLLLSHDARESVADFMRAEHTCETCFEEYRGRDLVRFLDCTHYQCRECVQRMAAVHLAEGSVDALRCHTCSVPWHPAIIRDVVGPDAADKYEARLLSKAIDRMVDTVYCSRCNAPAIREDGDMAQCFKCFYVFCTLCKEAWHPGSAC